MAFIFAFGSGLIVRALVMAGQASHSKELFATFNALIPQFGLFDLGGRVANEGWSPVGLWVVGVLAGYAILYSGAMLTLGWLRFRKQAI